MAAADRRLGREGWSAPASSLEEEGGWVEGGFL